MRTAAPIAPASGSPLRKIVTRNLNAHKLRLILTVLSVVLGTAFISGSFMFTATLQKSFDSIVKETTKGVDTVVKVDAKAERKLGVPMTYAAALRDLPEVGRAEAVIDATVGVVDYEGKPINTGGAPSIAFGLSEPGQQVGADFPVYEGREPQAPGEIALNRSALDRGLLHVGDRTTLYTPYGPGSQRMPAPPGIPEQLVPRMPFATATEVTIVGAYDIPTDTGGFVGAVLPRAQAIELLTNGITTESLNVAAAPGYTQAQVRDAVQSRIDEIGRSLPDQLRPQLRVLTGQQEQDAQVGQIREQLSFLNYFLLAFGAVALLVGTFIIYNTFSMIVAQRLRELALLRAIGASRSQLNRSVLVEAGAVGVIGSALGIGAGAGLVFALMAIFKAAGFGMPNVGLGLTTTAIVLPLVVGILVTLFSAWLPARRAGAIPPVAAMHSGDQVTEKLVTIRTITGAVLSLAGVGLAFAGSRGTDSNHVLMVGFGALLLIVGSFLVLPLLARPIVGGLGKVIGAPFGAIGRIAGRNAIRAPRRTAATAFALTLGLTLVTAIGMFGATMQKTIDRMFDQHFNADYILTVPQGFTFPDDVAGRVIGAGGVRAAASMRFGVPIHVRGADGSDVGTVVGGAAQVVGDPSATYLDFMGLGNIDGGIPKADDEVALQRDTANTAKAKIGDTVHLRGLDGAQIPVRVVGIFDAIPHWAGNIVITQAVLDRTVPRTSTMEQRQLTFGVLVLGDGSVSRDSLRGNLENAVAADKVVTVKNKNEFSGELAVQVNQMLTILYALLGLAVIIAILGIVNTLALSVTERRREIGMYRAVGMKRSQVRRTIQVESVQIAVFGALVGVGMGLYLGWAFLKTQSAQGLGSIAVPWNTVGAVLLGSVLVGVLASLWPARRAAKTSPLAAIHE